MVLIRLVRDGATISTTEKRLVSCLTDSEGS